MTQYMFAFQDSSHDYLPATGRRHSGNPTVFLNPHVLIGMGKVISHFIPNKRQAPWIPCCRSRQTELIGGYGSSEETIKVFMLVCYIIYTFPYAKLVSIAMILNEKW